MYLMSSIRIYFAPLYSTILLTDRKMEITPVFPKREFLMAVTTTVFLSIIPFSSQISNQEEAAQEQCGSSEITCF